MIANIPPGFVGAPSGGEILLILLVVLLLFGTKNLPKMARTLGRTLEEFRRAAREVTDEIMHAEDEPVKPPKPLKGAVSRDGGPRAPGAGDAEKAQEEASGRAAERPTHPRSDRIDESPE